MKLLADLRRRNAIEERRRIEDENWTDPTVDLAGRRTGSYTVGDTIFNSLAGRYERLRLRVFLTRNPYGHQHGSIEEYRYTDALERLEAFNKLHPLIQIVQSDMPA